MIDLRYEVISSKHCLVILIYQKTSHTLRFCLSQKTHQTTRLQFPFQTLVSHFQINRVLDENFSVFRIYIRKKSLAKFLWTNSLNSSALNDKQLNFSSTSFAHLKPKKIRELMFELSPLILNKTTETNRKWTHAKETWNMQHSRNMDLDFCWAKSFRYDNQFISPKKRWM